MRYDLTLEIAYDYRQPAPSLRNVLRVMPRSRTGEQEVTRPRLAIDPVPNERIGRTDFFGNDLTEIGFTQPVRSVTMTLTAEVRRVALAPQLDLTPDLARLATEIAQTRGLAPELPHHFLGPSPRIAPDPAISAFTRDCITPGMPALAAVRAVGAALHEHMTFDASATDVNTPPAEAFAARHGVCQDLSHIMIAGLRDVGIPAGYVSGFLRTTPPAGRARLQGADAMHAWIRAWCGSEAGWVEYDPTNDLMVGTDHIVAAIGRDYSDVAPVRGAVRLSGGHSSRHSVDLVPLG